MVTLLTRTVLLEASLLVLFYATGFLTLISVAVAVPLIRGGAPLIDVLVFLPNQMAFPATLALPLALVTATLSTMGRLRDDGELTALMSAGIGPVRILRSMLPLALVVAGLVAYLAFALMPTAYANFVAGKSSLLRQATATMVARQKPIHQDSDFQGFEEMSVSAMEADGNRLRHVFARYRTHDGRLWTGYAPEAIWATEEIEKDSEQDVDGLLDNKDMALTLHLLNAQMMHSTVGTEDLSDEQRKYLDQWNQNRTAEERTPLSVSMLQGDEKKVQEVVDAYGKGTPPYPVMIANLPKWSIQLVKERNVNKPPEAMSLGQLRETIEGLRANMDGAKAEYEKYANFLDQRLNIEGKPITSPEEAFYTTMAVQNFAKEVRKFTKDLNELLLAWHLRFMLPFAVVCYWIFACGLALSMPSISRMVAVFTGILIVMGSIFPALGIVKGGGQHVTLNPGWLLWLPAMGLALAGSLLVWRNR